MILNNRSVRAASFGLLLGAALPVASPLWAQGSPPRPVRAAPALPPTGEEAADNPPAPTADTVTLANALAKARLGRIGLGLAIGAADQEKTKTELAKFNTDTVERAALAFDLTTQTFGGVTAIGPLTYTELETDFSRANAFADMPPTQAFTLLLASLDDRQRTALTSKAGLGLSDLTTATQKQLFAVLLPEDEVFVSRRGAAEDAPNKSLGVLRDNASKVHFRMAQEVTLQCEVKGQEYGRQDVPPVAGADAPPTYNMASYSAYSNLSKVNGVEIRREVPNRLKRSDLNYNTPALLTTISIKDLKTVGDFIARAAKQTGLELYCDPHYENKTLTWVANGRTSASASEMLRAVAFGLTGTYRKVGTAFVLTEDVTGVGTRRKIVQDFEEECDAQRQQAVAEAEKSLKGNPAQQNLKLSGFNDPLAMSPEEEKTPVNLSLSKLSENLDVFSSLGSAALPYDKLTPKQQEAVQSYEAAYQKTLLQNNDDTRVSAYTPNFDGKIHVLKQLSMQMVIDGLDGAVFTDFGMTLMPLFKSAPKLTEIAADDLKMYANLPKWTESVKTFACRAVISRPHTTEEVDACLTRITALGFNQMWLVVFENGKARIPGTPFPLDPACDPKTDLLTYAIAEGKKKGVTVCPLIYAYSWGAKTLVGLRSLTLRGEDSALSAVRRFRINSLRPESPLEMYQPKPKEDAPSPIVFADPTNPEVQTALTGLFKAIADHAGAGDWICRDLTPKGFAGDNTENYNPLNGKSYDSLGYNEGLRLAYLKKNHCDPIDSLSMNFEPNTRRANTSLTNFEDDAAYEATQQWDQFRAKAHQTILRALFESARSNAGAAKPNLVFAQEALGGMTSWFDIWSDPKGDFPYPNLFGALMGLGSAGENSKAANANGSPISPPTLQASVFFLPKQPTSLPKEWANYAWRSVQLKTLEIYKAFRTWQGIAIEE